MVSVAMLIMNLCFEFKQDGRSTERRRAPGAFMR